MEPAAGAPPPGHTAPTRATPVTPATAPRTRSTRADAGRVSGPGAGRGRGTEGRAQPLGRPPGRRPKVEEHCPGPGPGGRGSEPRR